MRMRIASIKENDAQNSITGFTLSIWTQSCPHRCVGCYNEATWSEDGGYDCSLEELKNKISSSRHKNISLLGGEPFSPLNRRETIELIKWIKDNTNKTLYVWTGYRKEYIETMLDVSTIDYLIDGKFIKEELNLSLKLRSSNNQRVFKNGISIDD